MKPYKQTSPALTKHLLLPLLRLTSYLVVSGLFYFHKTLETMLKTLKKPLAILFRVQAIPSIFNNVQQRKPFIYAVLGNFKIPDYTAIPKNGPNPYIESNMLIAYKVYIFLIYIKSINARVRFKVQQYSGLIP